MTVKMMHWNILAQVLTDEKSFPHVPHQYLQYNHRFNLWLEHIEKVDADVVGLSEVDLEPYQTQLSSALAKLGYDCYFEQKPNGPTGSSIFWKRNKYECLEKRKFMYAEDGSQFLMFCRLASKSNRDHQIVFAETHLKAKPANMKKRSDQCVKIAEFFSSNYQHLPVFVAGDFNEEPQNEPIKTVMEAAFLDLYTLKLFQEQQFDEDHLKNHQPLTTFKYREESGLVKRTIDYMFVADNQFYQANGMELVSFLDLNDIEEKIIKGEIDSHVANPNKQHPSDHYSLAYELNIRYTV